MKTFSQISPRFKSLICFLILGQLSLVQAKVDPPNYNFSLDKFDLFFPGSKRETIKKSYPKEELVLKSGSFQTFRYFVEHIRYRFAILVQYKGDVVVDFHARLPPYFLHDVFHQSLINRYGKQDFYKNKKEQSIYIWKNKKNAKHTYVGACTITCFPIYYSVKKVDTKNLGSYKPILEHLNLSEKKTRPLQQSEADT